MPELENTAQNIAEASSQPVYEDSQYMEDEVHYNIKSLQHSIQPSYKKRT